MLSVEQDGLLGTLAGGPLLPLREDALDLIVRRLDLASLAALQLADRDARDADVYQIDAQRLRSAWGSVIPSPDTPTLDERPSPHPASRKKSS